MAKDDSEKIDARIAALEAQVAVLTDLLEGVSRVDVYDAVEDVYYDTLVFTGMNVQIVHGMGEETKDSNGMGNLLIGYNRKRVLPGEEDECLTFGAFCDRRTGSHNLVVGHLNNYTSRMGIVFGKYNEISRPHASVLGGEHNLASKNRATVAGGVGNTASGYGSSVSGGQGNTASGESASILGGVFKTAVGDSCVVGDDGVDC